MSSPPRTGRPRASSRETLADAACELFLERGYDATSIADIATRAGVSRSSFFNYFASKDGVLWAGLDERIDATSVRLRVETSRSVPAILVDLAAGWAPDSLALAIANAGAMGIDAELERDRALRTARLARAIAERVRADGGDALTADVWGGAYAGAVLAAIWRWADAGAGRLPLTATVRAALTVLPGEGRSVGLA